MSEGTAVQLEQKRFVINPESLEAMKRIRDTLPQLQEDYPFLSGFSFYGSRTKGTEKPSSDLDMRIFYNPSKSKDIFRAEGVEVPYVSRAKKAELATKLSEISGLALDSKEGVMTDISEERTDRDIILFTEHAKDYIEKGITEEDIDYFRTVPPAQNLFSQFFLAVGEGVYMNRAYIMESFKNMPHGEEYFQLLMKCLARMERDSSHKYPTPQYQRLPGTIEEAQRYFLIRQDPVEVIASKAA